MNKREIKTTNSQESFRETFAAFLEYEKVLKTVHVATCDPTGNPNSAPKMLINIQAPNKVYFLDYKYTQSYANLKTNNQLSLSFVDDDDFTGYRLTGICEVLESGPEFEAAKKSWEKRMIAYETDRIIRRIKGNYSTKESENRMPEDFVIGRLTAIEASVVKPGRILRVFNYEKGES